MSAVFRVPLGAPGLLRALSGGPRGPNNQTKVTATVRPAAPGVLRLRAGGQWNTRPRNTTDRRAEGLRRDRRVFRNPCQIRCFSCVLAPPGVQHFSKMYAFVFYSCRGVSRKGPPKGHAHKTFVNSYQMWGVVLLSFSCPLHF